MSDAFGTSLLSQPREQCPDERFRILYDTHECRVRGLIRKRFGDDAAVDDLVQEVFARAYTALPTLDPEIPSWPWLAAVARNLCADEFRRRARESLTPPPSTATTEGPENAAVARVHRAEVVEALTAIHPRQAQLLVRRHVDGLGYRELAALDDSTVAVVKSVLGRARRRFREHYREVVERTGLPAAAALTALREWVDTRTRRLTSAAALPEMAAGAHSIPGGVSAAAVSVAAGVTALLGPQLLPAANHSPSPVTAEEAPAPAPMEARTRIEGDPQSIGARAEPQAARPSARPEAVPDVGVPPADIDALDPLVADPPLSPSVASLDPVRELPDAEIEHLVGTDSPVP